MMKQTYSCYYAWFYDHHFNDGSSDFESKNHAFLNAIMMADIEDRDSSVLNELLNNFWGK